jgi:protocatechuate 3,4-dioxygenase beta subunit
MKRYRSDESSRIRILDRRRMLGLIGATAAAAVVGCDRGQTDSKQATGALAKAPTGSGAMRAPPCVVRPQQTEGPYFVDEKLKRSDIRAEPADGSVKEGLLLRLNFNVSRIHKRACTPLIGAVVDIWQCDAFGVYSDVRDIDGLFDTRGKQFLRGYQVTDASGMARFITIYPGWYPGRTVHIHFKVRTEPEAALGYEFTSQLYFDDAITDRVYARPPYSARGQRSVRNDEDYIFAVGGKKLILPLTKTPQGYDGTFDIGLKIT